MRYLISLAVLPGLFLIAYIYSLDKKDKEPLGLLLKLTGLGALTVISAMLLEKLGGYILPLFFAPDTDIYAFAECFFVIAMAEEGGKYFVMKKFAWNDENFDYMFDGVVYGVCVGLGFAIIENICYVLANGIGNAIMRAVTAIPGHATFGIYMGWYMSCAKHYLAKGNISATKLSLSKSFFVPVLLHGFYDFCLFAVSPVWSLVFYAFIAVLYVRTFRMIRKLSDEDKPIDNSAGSANGESKYSAENSNAGAEPTDSDYFGGL